MNRTCGEIPHHQRPPGWAMLRGVPRRRGSQIRKTAGPALPLTLRRIGPWKPQRAGALRRQVRRGRTLNTQLLTMYQDIGKTILQRQEQHGWDAKVIDRLSKDPTRRVPRDDQFLAQQPRVHATVRSRVSR